MVRAKKIIHEQDEITIDDNEMLSDTEEIILRSHQGVSVDLNAPLEKKSNNKEVLKRLLEIEKDIIKRARAKGVI